MIVASVSRIDCATTCLVPSGFGLNTNTRPSTFNTTDDMDRSKKSPIKDWIHRIKQKRIDRKNEKRDNDSATDNSEEMQMSTTASAGQSDPPVLPPMKAQEPLRQESEAEGENTSSLKEIDETPQRQSTLPSDDSSVTSRSPSGMTKNTYLPSITTSVSSLDSAPPVAQQQLQQTFILPLASVPSAASSLHNIPTGPSHERPLTNGSIQVEEDMAMDNASVLTLASSSKNRYRRQSIDTNASIRALPPSSRNPSQDSLARPPPSILSTASILSRENAPSIVRNPSISGKSIQTKKSQEGVVAAIAAHAQAETVTA